MSQPAIAVDPANLDSSADLQTILAAWHTATLRLEQTHDALRDEVRQLTAELEVKNRELARKNRLADLGQMASHVAHEVRNNLVPVTLYLSMLRRRVEQRCGEPRYAGEGQRRIPRDGRDGQRSVALHLGSRSAVDLLSAPQAHGRRGSLAGPAVRRAGDPLRAQGFAASIRCGPIAK